MGGAKSSNEEERLSNHKDALEVGASRVVFGRKVTCDSNPEKLVRNIVDLVHHKKNISDIVKRSSANNYVIKHNKTVCTGCGICSNICKHKSGASILTLTKNEYSYELNICDKCGKCQSVCPNEAIFIGTNIEITYSFTRCGLCVEVCPNNCLSLVENEIFYCTYCAGFTGPNVCECGREKALRKEPYKHVWNMGKLLRIDLTKRKYKIENVDRKIYEEYFGGMGLATYYMLQELDFEDDPLSESNKISIAVGPLTGTIAPTSSRFGIFTKSPATGGYLESYCGGDFGKEIKQAGYDMLIIEGRSTELVYIEIYDDKVNFRDASQLKGATATDTLAYFRAHYEGWENLYVGPAGERMSPLAGVFSDQRCAGRGGGGAVFGSKNIK